ncbi:ABC transporter ATP-binding protein [Mesomycoplasma molare]|uniref:ABC transporter ATP-binding protein/permease n=1 Tax=Mesomycoplasma molare TaxID=171288 RepID=A0ABY5TUS6_9BACT|nr:ABC transporter ATP-binding protein [Mesomycoplasma molare]UWD34407.1 ABC transporter ATP-binding protein/permease [Mesomycoplasma molare]
MKWAIKSSKKYTILYIIAEIINVLSSFVFGMLIAYISSIVLKASISIDDKTKDLKTIIVILFAILFTDFFTKFTIWWRVKLDVYFRMKLINALIENVFNKFQDSNAKNNYEFDGSKIFNVIFNDSMIVFDQVILSIIKIIGNTVALLVSLITAAFISFYLIPIIIVIILFSIILSFFFNKKQTKKQTDFSEARTNFLQLVDNYLDGFKILYYANKTKKIADNSLELNKKLFEASLKINNAQNLNEFIPDKILAILQYLSILIIAILLFLNVEHITIFTLTFVNYLFPRLISSVPSYISQIKKIKTSKNIIKKIEFNIEKENSKLKLNQEIEKIEIKNLSFSYLKEEKVFNNVNLSFEKGKKYLIKGESGSGKSTLLKLILGIEENFKGSILINDTDIKNISDISFKNYITYLNSDNIIFDDSIMNNIVLWQEPENNKLEASLQKANLLEEIKNKLLSNENALKLSEGQKQRLSLARTFYLEKTFLIFDEVFSNLDRKNVETILNNLIEDKNITLILINHNLDEIHYKKFDAIIDMENLK